MLSTIDSFYDTEHLLWKGVCLLFCHYVIFFSSYGFNVVNLLHKREEGKRCNIHTFFYLGLACKTSF